MHKSTNAIGQSVNRSIGQFTIGQSVNRFIGRFSFLILAAGISLAADAASKVRLIYGEDWSPAGRAVKKTLLSSAFRTATQGRFSVELINEKYGEGEARENLGSTKLPAIFVISERGNCYFAYENVPYDITAEKLAKYLDKADRIRQEAERQSLVSVDELGTFLQKMEKYVGGPRRVISKGFYDDIYAKLKKADPEDKEGWQRHFEMWYMDGGKRQSCRHSDGLEIVERANAYREKNETSLGTAFINEEFSKPRKHLTKEQTQSLLMAKFALYREDASRTEEMNKLLQKVAQAGETTFWGTCAMGWLNWRKVPLLSVYFGWRKGDFKGSRFATDVVYGVQYSFNKVGHYTIAFDKDGGSSGQLKIESIELKAGDEVVATLKTPAYELNRTSFEYDLKRENRGRITSITVKGQADDGAGTSGKILIKRQVLRPRKAAK